MKATKFVVLAAGILGIVSFFLPLIAVQKSGIEGKLSAFVIVKGIDKASEVVNGGAAAAASAADVSEANDALAKIKGIVLGIYAPAALLLLIGAIGVARKKFGRVAGTFSLLIGLIGLGIASLLLTAAKDPGVSQANDSGGVAGVGMYVMFLAALLGAVAGLVTLVKPDRG